MATQNATTAQGGYLTNEKSSLLFTWGEVVNDGSATSSTVNYSSMMTEASILFGRSDIWRCRRSYLVFDTSAITGTVTSLDLKAYCTAKGDSNYSPGVIPQITTSPNLSNSLVSGDFDRSVFDVDVSAEVYPAVSSWNTWGLDGYAQSYVQENAEMTIVLRDFFYDYNYDRNGMNPPGIGWCTFYYNTSGYYPYLEYTMVTGYGNTVNGVISANIGLINGVETANIFKVNGV